VAKLVVLFVFHSFLLIFREDKEMAVEDFHIEISPASLFEESRSGKTTSRRDLALGPVNEHYYTHNRA
jgi:hypothetical protein